MDSARLLVANICLMYCRSDKIRTYVGNVIGPIIREQHLPTSSSYVPLVPAGVRWMRVWFSILLMDKRAIGVLMDKCFSTFYTYGL